MAVVVMALFLRFRLTATVRLPDDTRYDLMRANLDSLDTFRKGEMAVSLADLGSRLLTFRSRIEKTARRYAVSHADVLSILGTPTRGDHASFEMEYRYVSDSMDELHLLIWFDSNGKVVACPIARRPHLSKESQAIKERLKEEMSQFRQRVVAGAKTASSAKEIDDGISSMFKKLSVAAKNCDMTYWDVVEAMGAPSCTSSPSIPRTKGHLLMMQIDYLLQRECSTTWGLSLVFDEAKGGCLVHVSKLHWME